MKILVTGGAGFIGAHVVDTYLKLGHQVAVLDDLSRGRQENVNPQAKFVKGDIRDHQLVEGIFKTENIEVLNHHAAQISIRQSVENPLNDADVNILGLLNLLETGRKYGLKKVIFASSGGAIYGETDVLPTPENHPIKPYSPYGVSKYSSELYLNFYQQNYEVPAVVLRYANVYGPRQDPHGEAGVVAIFSQMLLANKTPLINGDGEQRRDFVYVGDVVKANIRALDVKDSLTVNIGTGISTSVNELFNLLGKITGVSVEANYGPPKKGEQRRSCLKIIRAKKLLDFEPRIKLKEGLKKTVEYFKRQNIQ